MSATKKKPVFKLWLQVSIPEPEGLRSRPLPPKSVNTVSVSGVENILNNLLITVKTTHNFHYPRVVILLETWSQCYKKFYSWLTVSEDELDCLSPGAYLRVKHLKCPLLEKALALLVNNSIVLDKPSSLFGLFGPDSAMINCFPWKVFLAILIFLRVRMESTQVEHFMVPQSIDRVPAALTSSTKNFFGQTL